MTLADIARGAAFFPWFAPSFCNLGYQARRLFWGPDPWSEADRTFDGQTWLVTGASEGIGRQIGLAAATAGARVLAVARTPEKLDALRAAATGHVECWTADLSEMVNVEDLANRLAEGGRHIDVLVNNVGAMLERPARTREGLDAGFATNLLGHYALTESLIGRKVLAEDAIVVNMSSGGMYNVPLRVAELSADTSRPYNGTLAYAYHKRAQSVLNAHWRRTWGSDASRDRRQSYVMHPGWVDTPGVALSMPEFRRALGPVLRAPEAGADTALWLAATRPTQASPEGIWFDRSLCGAHPLPGTRHGDTPEDLLDYLNTSLEAVTDSSRAVAAASV